MTENKRFTFKHFDWLQWHIFDNGEYLCEVSLDEDAENLCKLLNELHKENIRLKRDFDSCSHNWALMYDEAKEKVEELSKENKQLKNKLQTYKTTNSLLKATMDRHRTENQQIRDTINEMYENERTELGKSTLKQLLEQIE